MQKLAKNISAVVGRVLFIGFSIQILLGTCWMICNLVGAPNSPYEGALYLVQSGFAFLVFFYLLTVSGVTGTFRRCWGALALLTFPMGMQCHFTVGADSLTASLLLLEIALVTGILRKGQQSTISDFVKLLICWVVAALLQPAYLVIGLVPVLLVFLYNLVKGRKKQMRALGTRFVLLLAFGGLIFMMADLVRGEAYLGQIPRKLSLCMSSRLGWPYEAADYEAWPEEAKALFVHSDARQMEYRADNLEPMLVRPLEEAYGEEKAREILQEIARLGWQNHRGEILRRIAWDGLGYTLSPLVLQRQFEGKIYDSYSGVNYDRMRSQAPYLTSYYMTYGCWWFGVGLILTAFSEGLTLLGVLVEKFKRKTALANGGRKVLQIVFLSCTAGVPVLMYTLRGAGMMDYKKGIAVSFLWIWWMLIACVRGMCVEETESER